MHKRIANRKQKKKILAIILCLMMVLAIAMPVGAMGEIQETDENSETEIEVTYENDNSEATTETDVSETISQEEATGDKEINDSADETMQENIDDLDAKSVAGEENSAELLDIDETIDTADVSGTTAPDVVGEIDASNEWQIVSEEYSGREQTDKKAYDIDKDGSDDIYYQKNVIPTGVENEFRIYLGITKKMTWDELLAESDFAITTSNSWHSVAVGTTTKSINGNPSTIYPGKVTSGANNYEAVVNYERNGQVVHTYRGWYHGTTPNCANGTGFIKLKSLGIYLVASHTVNLGNGGNQLTFTIDLDAMTSKNINFALEDIVVDSVQDTMGDYITYEDAEYCDGTNSNSGDTLTWIPESNGVDGVQVQDGNGLTGYHYNVHQLVYKVHLKAEKEKFNSCAQNMNSKVGDKESYQTNQQAILNCHMGTYTGKTELQVPYVRGLLYDLEFQKTITDSNISVSGISFTISRKQEGSTIAETLEKTVQESTDDDGWIKFHNLPWGIYTLQELSGNSDSFQEDYLDGTEELNSYELRIGKVINNDGLKNDHGTGHSVDQVNDVDNLLFLYNQNGVFENTPNQAKITIKKIVNEYEAILDDLKDQEYVITTDSTGVKDIYLQPEETDTALTKLKGRKTELKHQETEVYNLIVPKDGGEINIEEIIPEAIQNKIVFESAEVTQNNGSTEVGAITKTEQGCKVNVLPGNDITITITNVPVGTVKIHKVVDNYQDKLVGDDFIIRVSSVGDDGATVNTETVLAHNETSGKINITKTTTLNIEEVVPKEYSLSKIEISGGGSLKGNQVTVRPGEDVVITVHNSYSSKSFFHAADAIRNLFIP